mmetsp:Transcript_15507/g.26213  ORF Transcript_15507/g.26213 Transcript_15507/m.26213 type:complete len:120 (+) Transcript_15507:292-651(+)
MPKSSLFIRDNSKCYLLVIGKDFGVKQQWVRQSFTGKYSLQVSPGIWILGNNFLHNYYSIYDLENEKVGLVPAKGSKISVIQLESPPSWTHSLANFSSAFYASLFIVVAVLLSAYIYSI